MRTKKKRTYTAEQARSMFRDFLAFTMAVTADGRQDWIEVRLGSLPLCPEFEEAAKVEAAFLAWLDAD